jgi:hypothetical protein
MLLTMTVDTEEEWDWKAGWPTAPLSVTNIRRLPRFQELCDRYRVAPTYFTNQAVLDDAEARAVIQALARSGRAEIGMHIHPWNTPPLEGKGPVQARDTFLHNLPPGLILRKLSSVYESFAKSGLRPTSFRGGRYSSGDVAHTFLRDHGFLADASILPYMTWADDGAPDYRAVGLEPVRPPPRAPSDTPFWLIPLTLGFTRRPFAFWQECYQRVEATWLRKLHLIGLAERLGLVRKVWLNFEDPLGRGMLPFLRRLRTSALPCVCCTVHSSSLVAGVGPYTRTRADEDRLFAQMEEVFAMVASWPDWQSATVSEVARKLEEQPHACTGN